MMWFDGNSFLKIHSNQILGPDYWGGEALSGGKQILKSYAIMFKTDQNSKGSKHM